jgi:hypothetical protein
MTGNNNALGKLDNRFVKDIREGIVYRCMFTAIEGYRLMKKAKEYKCAWEEESLTANLIKHMKDSRYCKKWKLDISPEYPIHTPDISNGTRKPKEASRVDMRVVSWSYPEKMEYCFEAKNLAEHDWFKPEGSKVRSSFLRGRYIAKGIDHFVKETYPLGGLLGYVLEGSVDNILKGINKLLKSNRRNRAEEMLIPSDTINNHRECYRSQHKKKSGESFILNHILFNFVDMD